MATQTKKKSLKQLPTRRKPKSGRAAASRKEKVKAGPKSKTIPATSRAAKKNADVNSGLSQVLASAAAGLTDLITQASENTLAANPLIGIQRGDIANAGSALLSMVARSPKGAVKHLGNYLGELSEIIKGRSELAPDPKDRRFADPAWQSNFLYKRLLQGWLATRKELSGYVDQTAGDAQEKGRAQFIISLLTDALSPGNFLLGNPVAVRKLLDTGGASLVKGLQNLVHDIRHNNMMPSQVDMSGFKVGENLATSKGDIVHRAEMFELIQYAPTKAEVYRRPLLMAPPQVNKYYAIDLTPDKSLIQWMVDSGIQTFVMSWRNPTAKHRHWGIAEYALAVDEAVDVVRRITGSDDINMWGSCSGGMTLAAYLGYAAAGSQRKVAHTTWGVCVLDMSETMEGTALGLFNTPGTIRAAKARSQRKGFIDGAEMQSMFAWLRPNDLVWNYWVNNYLLGNKPPAYDILAWNADTTRLPAKYHADLLGLIEKNPYVTPGALQIAGRAIDLSKVDVGAYVIGGLTDHITPWKGCYGTARLFGEHSTYVLTNAGHLQSLLNPPGTPKAFFFSAPAQAATADDWAKTAVRQEGSWWPHWREWIRARSGELIKAPKKAGSRKYPSLCAAPGTYIFE